MNRSQALELLGVNEDQLKVANADAVLKASYKKRALACHPDKNPNNPNAHQAFASLSEAYQFLCSNNVHDKKGNSQSYEPDDLFREVFGEEPFPDYKDLREQTTEEIVNKFMSNVPPKNPGKGHYAIQLMITYCRVGALKAYSVLRNIDLTSPAKFKETIQHLLYDKKGNPLIRLSANNWFGEQDGMEAMIDTLCQHEHIVQAIFGAKSVKLPKNLEKKMADHVARLQANTEDWQMKYAKAAQKREEQMANTNVEEKKLPIKDAPGKKPAVAKPKSKVPAVPSKSNDFDLNNVIIQDEDVPTVKAHWHGSEVRIKYYYSVITSIATSIAMLITGYALGATLIAGLGALAVGCLIQNRLEAFACHKAQQLIEPGTMGEDKESIFALGNIAATSYTGWLKSFTNYRAYLHYDIYLAGKHVGEHNAPFTKPNKP